MLDERLNSSAGPVPSLGARILRHSFTRFAALGVMGLGVDVALLGILLRFTAASKPVAVTLAFLATYAINFFLNRRFSFSVHGGIERQLARFLPQIVLDYVLMLTAFEVLGALGIGALLARVLAGGTNAAVNYTAYRFWTFRSSDA
jgi:putative flippase GtrA